MEAHPPYVRVRDTVWGVEKLTVSGTRQESRTTIGIDVELSYPGPVGVTQGGRKVYRHIEERAFSGGMVLAHGEGGREFFDCSPAN